MQPSELVTKDYLDNVVALLMAEIKKKQNNTLPELLKSKEVRKLLGCSDSTLQYYRDSGQISFKKVGGVYYYPKEAFSELFN